MLRSFVSLNNYFLHRIGVNKTLELRSVNIEKGNDAAYDFVKSKYDIEQYKQRVNDLYSKGSISKTKYKNLLTSFDEINNGFIERDLRDSQYIAKKAKEMLLTITKCVVSTTGSITARLREDWQLVDIMKELNWDKYDKLGLTHKEQTKDGSIIKKIDNWTKRNDNRHHAMDAITIAFTKHSYIQYLNYLNARSDKFKSNKDNNNQEELFENNEIVISDSELRKLSKQQRHSVIYAIEQKELHRDNKHKLVFNSPITPLNEFRKQAKDSLENIVISIKTKNKVATNNINTVKSPHGKIKKVQLTPRGALHKETICSAMKVPIIKTKKITASFTKEDILKVCNKDYREALLKRLEEFSGDSKKAFSGKNNLERYPIYYGKGLSKRVPLEVKIFDGYDIIYTVRKDVNKDLPIDKVIDKCIQKILQERLKEYGNAKNKAFSNLDENPIYLNKEKGITIKKVRVKHLNNAIALHSKRDKNGEILLDNNGNTQAVDFVDTGNNHHVAIYQDNKGELQENIVSFFEAMSRKLNGMSIIDKQYKASEGWMFLFSMKQNEFFLFPDNDFNPTELSKDYIMDPKNYHILSPHLYRVQKLSSKDYYFRHHLETNVEENYKLRNVTWKRIQTPSNLKGIVKVRVNHIGRIVAVGEY